MGIAEIDKNFIIKSTISEPDIVWYNVTQEPFTIKGVIYEEERGRFSRFPQNIAETVSKDVAWLNKHTSGGRVRFKTNSSYIAIHAVMEQVSPMSHMPLTGQAGFDIYRMVDGRETYFKTFVPPAKFEEGYSVGTKTLCEFTDYTINFPLYHGVKNLYIGLKKDAVLEQAEPYKNELPIVYYGSSITQGGCASRPGNSYQGFLSRRLSTDFVNFGFSGSGMGEAKMAEYIADMDMSVFVMDYDSNAPTPEHLAATHYAFYKIIRDKNPDLPIILISHPDALHGVAYKTDDCDYNIWGPFEKRRDIIKETYTKAKENGDNYIYFIDGFDIYKGEEWDAVTVDGIHPNDFGFFKFARYLEKYLKPLLERR